MIPLFLVIIFAAAIFSSKARIPHILMLVIFGIIITFLNFAGPGIIHLKPFRIDPNLIINFIIPPLIFKAMINVDYKYFKEVRILCTLGVVVA